MGLGRGLATGPIAQARQPEAVRAVVPEPITKERGWRCQPVRNHRGVPTLRRMIVDLAAGGEADLADGSPGASADDVVTTDG